MHVPYGRELSKTARRATADIVSDSAQRGPDEGRNESLTGYIITADGKELYAIILTKSATTVSSNRSSRVGVSLKLVAAFFGHGPTAFGRGCVKTQIATPRGSDCQKPPWDFDVLSEVLELRRPI